MVDDWSALGQGRVELVGDVEALTTLFDPLGGQAAVAMSYRAWPPSTTVGIDGATRHGSRAFEIRAQQAVDFLLVRGTDRLLVRPDPGDDIDSLHRDLVRRYGVGLRAEVEMVRPGDSLVVTGRVLEQYAAGGSPLRADPYLAAVGAERLRLT